MSLGSYFRKQSVEVIQWAEDAPAIPRSSTFCPECGAKLG